MTTLRQLDIRAERHRVGEWRTIQFVFIEINNNFIAIFNKRDQATERGFRADVANDEAHGAAGKACVRHEPNINIPFST